MNANVAQHHADHVAFDVVHADLLRFFPELVRELGGDPDALLRQAGVEADALSNHDAGVGFRAWVSLLESAASHLGCPDFGMRLARRQGGGRVFGLMGIVMKNSATFGDAIRYVADHPHAHSLAALIRLVREEDRFFIAHDFLVDGVPNKRQAVEQVMLLGHLNALDITGGEARGREVRFRHQPLSSRSAYRAYFGGAAVRFEERDEGLVFSSRDLRAPIIAPDPQQYVRATASIDARFSRIAQPLHAQVRALVVRFIETPDCSIERVCAELDLHPRTLHRRLKLEGKSFEGIKDDVRRDYALRYLQETNHSLSVIAAKLGYAEQSVLTRSCIRWFSVCPSELRIRAVH